MSLLSIHPSSPSLILRLPHGQQHEEVAETLERLRGEGLGVDHYHEEGGPLPRDPMECDEPQEQYLMVCRLPPRFGTARVLSL